MELDDGRLLLALYGCMDGDDVRMEYPTYPLIERGMAYKARVILAESADRGKTWRYHCTVCNHPELVKEGCNETSIVRLPSGDLFAAIRTGMFGYWDEHGREHLDEPLLTAWSRCDGRQWSEPTRIYVDDRLITGIYPKAIVTKEGVLGVMVTRPYGRVVFNPDGTGTIWTDEVEFGNEYERGMATMALIGPHTLFAVYMGPDYAWDSGLGRGHIMGVPITVKRKKRPGSVTERQEVPHGR